MINKLIAFFLIAVFVPIIFINNAPAQDMTPWARDPRPYRQRQREKRSDYQEYKREHNLDQLRQNLNLNNNLSNAQREEFISLIAQYYAKAGIITQTQFTQDLAFFKNITNDPNLAQSEKINRLREYLTKKKQKH